VFRKTKLTPFDSLERFEASTAASEAKFSV